jgi:hypothetical protein
VRAAIMRSSHIRLRWLRKYFLPGSSCTTGTDLVLCADDMISSYVSVQLLPTSNSCCAISCVIREQSRYPAGLIQSQTGPGGAEAEWGVHEMSKRGSVQGQDLFNVELLETLSFMVACRSFNFLSTLKSRSLVEFLSLSLRTFTRLDDLHPILSSVAALSERVDDNGDFVSHLCIPPILSILTVVELRMMEDLDSFQRGSIREVQRLAAMACANFMLDPRCREQASAEDLIVLRRLSRNSPDPVTKHRCDLAISNYQMTDNYRMLHLRAKRLVNQSRNTQARFAEDAMAENEPHPSSSTTRPPSTERPQTYKQ